MRIRTSLALFVVLGVLLGLAACGGDEAAPPQPVPEAPRGSDGGPSTPPTPEAAADPCAVPDGSLRGDAAAGAVTYQTTCIACHGATPPPMDPKPVNHSDCGYMNALSDAHLYKVICGGGAAVDKSPTMPPWGAMLGPDQIRGVIAHLRSLCPG